MTPRRSLVRALIPAVLICGSSFIFAAHAAAAQPGAPRVDGYLSRSGRCLMLRQHDGAVLSLVGGIEGLRRGDHVRLGGRFLDASTCGNRSFEVTSIDTLWGDDNHRTTVYDHLSGEPFLHYAERTGRIERRYGEERRSDRYAPPPAGGR